MCFFGNQYIIRACACYVFFEVNRAMTGCVHSTCIPDSMEQISHRVPSPARVVSHTHGICCTVYGCTGLSTAPLNLKAVEWARQPTSFGALYVLSSIVSHACLPFQRTVRPFLVALLPTLFKLSSLSTHESKQNAPQQQLKPFSSCLAAKLLLLQELTFLPPHPNDPL